MIETRCLKNVVIFFHTIFIFLLLFCKKVLLNLLQLHSLYETGEATKSILLKKLFLKILQNSQEKPVPQPLFK